MIALLTRQLFFQDSCYEGKLDENECKIDIAIRLCVTVVAFSPESIRATQMLVGINLEGPLLCGEYFKPLSYRN